jgi:hypothetical protein
MIQTFEFLTPDECEQVGATVDALRAYWESTSAYGRTYVLGAASYIHAIGGAGPAYHDRARRLTPVLRARFGWMYARLTASLARGLGAPVALAEQLAPPGFHVYRWDPQMHLLRCSVHVDLQFEAHDFTRYGAPDLAHPLSFTVAIRAPATGAGMNVWDHTHGEARTRSRPDFRRELDATPPRRVRYGLGELTVHSGLHFHQIAPIVLEPGETRLTLQGHAIRCGDTWQAYW